MRNVIQERGKMKKRILSIALVLTLAMALIIPAVAIAATDSQVVNVTVTGELVSITVGPGAVAYGALAAGASEDTTLATGTDETQTVTNTGTVAVDLTIASSDAAGTTPWVLAASTGILDEYTHEASIDGFTTPISLPSAASYVTLAGGVAALGTQDFDLRITMPTSITDYGAHTIVVTVLATGP